MTEAADPVVVVRRVLLIGNDHSRAGAAATREAEALLAQAGIAVTRAQTRARHEISPAIVAHAGAVDAVLVAGGDGTLNAAAAGIAATGLPLGVLPAGTANDLARTLDLPADLAGCIALVRAGRLRTIDLGEVNGLPFFNVASFGLSADLAKNLTREDKRRWGRLAYAVAAIKALTTARPFRAEIVAQPMGASAPARVRVKSWQIAVGNGVFYGGGMAVSDETDIDNQRLELYSLEMKSLWKLAPMFFSLRAGSHRLWTEVRAMSATEISITTRRPRPINADGELIARTPATFRVRPRAVRVFANPKAVHASGNA